MADEERPPALPSSSSTSHQSHKDAASSKRPASTSSDAEGENLSLKKKKKDNKKTVESSTRTTAEVFFQCENRGKDPLSMADEERLPAPPSSSSTSHQRHKGAASSEPLPSTSNEGENRRKEDHKKKDIKERIASSAPKTYTEETTRLIQQMEEDYLETGKRDLAEHYDDAEEWKRILAEIYHDPEEWKRISAELIDDPEERERILAELYDDPEERKRFLAKVLDKELDVRRVLKRVYDDTRLKNAYIKALQIGAAKNTRIPIMIVGQDRTGKTSLEKHLLGKPFDNTQPSTDGVDVDVVELTDENAEDYWIVKEVKFFVSADQAKDETLKYTTKLVVTEEQDQDSQATKTFPEESHTDEVDYSIQQSFAPDVLHSVQKSVRSLGLQGIRKKSSNIESITAFVHDFAGQSIYYDTHLCFLKRQCACLLVVDVSSDLDKPAKPRFKFHDFERDMSDPFLETNFDYLLSWLTVLGILGSPPVLIVLTNSDQCKTEDIKAVKQRIEDVVFEKEFVNVSPEIHVIDNTLSDRNNPEIRKLRRKLYELCKSILDQQQPVPVRWLEFEALLSDKMVNESLVCIDIEECRAIARSCKVADIDSAMAFLHHQGIIVHHSDSPFVVLYPPWLMNLFTEIISIPETKKRKPEDARYHKRLSQGILMQEDLHKKLKNNAEYLEKLMVQFSLICPWEYEGKAAYLVPSVCPLMVKGEDVQKELSHSPIVSIFINFNCLYVPVGFYTRFQTTMINKCKEDLESEPPTFFCNYTRLTFKHSEGSFDVYLIKIPRKIKVGVFPLAKSSEHANLTFVSYLKKVIIECTKIVIEEQSLVCRNVTASLVLKCSPSCLGKTEACRLQHGKERCSRDECGYFWSLEELQCFTEDPRCQHNPVKAETFSIHRVRHWLDAVTDNKLIQNSREIYDNDSTPPPELNISLPTLRDIKPEQLEWSSIVPELPIDLLLVTVKDHEHASCFYYLANRKRSHCNGLGMVDIGNFCDGKVKVALIKCLEGSTGPTGSLIRVRNAVDILKPKAAISVGHCATVDPAKAKLGDVVISAKLATYSSKKITHAGKEELCGFKTNVSKNMGDLIPSAADGWEPPLKEPGDLEIVVHRNATILSGPESINNSERRQELLRNFTDAIAIEMEGEGLYSAAFDLGIEWVVVKGISNSADGRETDWQPFASAMAASLVCHMFKYPDVIKHWPHYEKPVQ